MPPRPKPRLGAEEALSMIDVITAILGTGGILLMAAYAELCERI